jgi:hypothetical protein
LPAAAPLPAAAVPAQFFKEQWQRAAAAIKARKKARACGEEDAFTGDATSHDTAATAGNAQHGGPGRNARPAASGSVASGQHVQSFEAAQAFSAAQAPAPAETGKGGPRRSARKAGSVQVEPAPAPGRKDRPLRQMLGRACKLLRDQF